MNGRLVHSVNGDNSDGNGRIRPPPRRIETLTQSTKILAAELDENISSGNFWGGTRDVHDNLVTYSCVFDQRRK